MTLYDFVSTVKYAKQYPRPTK